jgi:ribonuclease P protein component
MSEDLALAEASAEARDLPNSFGYLGSMHPDLSVIRKRSDFLAANRGLRIARPGFVLLALPNEGRGKRYGITVTKKIGNAVVRNRMKRRFRELLWSALPEQGLPDYDHVLIGREGGVECDFGQLREELSAALSRAAEGKGDRPRAPRKPRSRRA